MNDVAIRYFKKQSKELLKKYDEKTHWAVLYVGKFLRDNADLRLTGAQYVIARSVGYKNWNELLKATEFMQRQAMVTHYEQLEMNGYRKLTSFGKTREKTYFDFLDGQARLARSIKVKEIHDWLLTNIDKIKTPNTYSYGFKHRYEKYFGYTANGEMILASILGDFTVKREDWGPNAHLAFSKRSIKSSLDKLKVEGR